MSDIEDFTFRAKKKSTAPNRGSCAEGAEGGTKTTRGRAPMVAAGRVRKAERKGKGAKPPAGQEGSVAEAAAESTATGPHAGVAPAPATENTNTDQKEFVAKESCSVKGVSLSPAVPSWIAIGVGVAVAAAAALWMGQQMQRKQQRLR